MSAIAWQQIEDAIHAWVVNGSGLAADRVVWAGQNQPERAVPFITIRVSSIRRRGNDWTNVEDAASPAPGAELQKVIRGPRIIGLTIQCFAASPIGAAGALAILENVAIAVQRPVVSEVLDAARVGIGNISDVEALDGVIGSTLFEPRAIMTVSLHTVSELDAGTLTYIETVDVENQTTTPSETFRIP